MPPALAATPIEEDESASSPVQEKKDDDFSSPFM
jgi:hypothetical protein